MEKIWPRDGVPEATWEKSGLGTASRRRLEENLGAGRRPGGGLGKTGLRDGAGRRASGHCGAGRSHAALRRNMTAAVVRAVPRRWTCPASERGGRTRGMVVGGNGCVVIEVVGIAFGDWRFSIWRNDRGARRESRFCGAVGDGCGDKLSPRRAGTGCPSHEAGIFPQVIEFLHRAQGMAVANRRHDSLESPPHSASILNLRSSNPFPLQSTGADASGSTS